MLAIKDLREDIRLGFAIFQDYVRPGGALNLSDINVHAEDFVADILNAIHHWSLVNTNTTKRNYPCIDLVEEQERLGIQVTSEKGASKINDAIERLETNGVSQFIGRFKVFSLIPRQRSYKITKTCAGVAFNWRNDVLDFDSVLGQVNSITDLAKLQAIHTVVTSAMPKFFASRRDMLRELRARLEADLTVFDRQVMDAPFRYEDPLLMLKAIRQMRIALQRNASCRISHEVAARNFDAAKKILADMEYQVRDRFPYIHAAAMKGETHMQYEDGDFDNAIALMMQIRTRLGPLLDEVQQELQKIDAQL